MTTVPLSAISQTDDTGKDVSPEVGDVVDLGKAKAKVESIDGDNVTLSITEVNGAPVAADAGPDDGTDDDSQDEPANMKDAVDSAGHAAMGKMLQRAMRSSDKSNGF